MATRARTTLEQLCSEIGMEHLQATELFRRINREVMDDREVPVQLFGNFYKRVRQPRIRRLNGVDYMTPLTETVALRGQRFPAELTSTDAIRLQLSGQPTGLSGETVRIIVRRAGTYEVSLEAGVTCRFEIHTSRDFSSPLFQGDSSFAEFEFAFRIELDLPESHQRYDLANFILSQFGQVDSGTLVESGVINPGSGRRSRTRAYDLNFNPVGFPREFNNGRAIISYITEREVNITDLDGEDFRI